MPSISEPINAEIIIGTIAVIVAISALGVLIVNKMSKS